LSALIALTSGIAWIRSYIIGDQFIWHDGSEQPLTMNEYGVTCCSGGIQFYHWHQELRRGALGGGWDARHYSRHVILRRNAVSWSLVPFGYPYYRMLDGMATTDISATGFEFAYRHDNDAPNVSNLLSVTMPLAVLFFPAAIFFAVWNRHWLRRRRQEGHCPICGYDIRATPERCPECGEVVQKAV
jgi:hypothetical protein